MVYSCVCWNENLSGSILKGFFYKQKTTKDAKFFCHRDTEYTERIIMFYQVIILIVKTICAKWSIVEKFLLEYVNFESCKDI
jgi:hypothetical protein